MKKLKLKLQDFKVDEVLTRDQLKSIFGGDEGSGSGVGCENSCEDIGQDCKNGLGKCYRIQCIADPAIYFQTCQ